MGGLLLRDKASAGGERCELLNSYHGTEGFECQMLNSPTFHMNFAVSLPVPRVGFLPVPVSLIVRYFK